MGVIRFTAPVWLMIVVWMCGACAARADPMEPDHFVSESAAAFAYEEREAEQAAADGESWPRQVIANANLSLIVADAQATLAGVQEVLSDLGGYMSDMDLSKGGFEESEVMRGTLTLRVPSESLEEALARLQALARDVNYLHVNRQDVTDQYSDLDARLRNLRATETELLALLTEVRERPNAKVEDILAVHRNLTQIREEIELLQGRKNLLSNQIDYSTIWVELIPDSVFRPIVEEPWSASGPVRSALRALVSTLQGLLTALIWAVLYLTPLLLVFLIPLAALIWLLRLFAGRRRKDEDAG